MDVESQAAQQCSIVPVLLTAFFRALFIFDLNSRQWHDRAVQRCQIDQKLSQIYSDCELGQLPPNVIERTRMKCQSGSHQQHSRKKRKKKYSQKLRVYNLQRTILGDMQKHKVRTSHEAEKRTCKRESFSYYTMAACDLLLLRIPMPRYAFWKSINAMLRRNCIVAIDRKASSLRSAIIMRLMCQTLRFLFRCLIRVRCDQN